MIEYLVIAESGAIWLRTGNRAEAFTYAAWLNSDPPELEQYPRGRVAVWREDDSVTGLERVDEDT